MSVLEILLSKEVVPAYITAVAILLGIISCASNDWSVYAARNATSGILCYTNGTTCEGPTLAERGTTLAFLLLALFLLVGSILMVAMAIRRDAQKFFKASIHVTDAAVVLYVIGLAIYLHGSLTTIDVGWGYWLGIATLAVALTSSIVSRLMSIFFK